MADIVAQQLDEKCEVLETLSKCQQEVGALLFNQTANYSRVILNNIQTKICSILSVSLSESESF